MRQILWVIALPVVLELAGCNPATTRLPTLEPAPTAFERQSQARFDPFPDEDVGPETAARPPSFENTREEPREAAEQRLRYPRLGPVAPLGGEYPQAVRQ